MRGAKVGHKKARTGCLTCRSRKVKCDELCPRCSNCTRLRLACEYPMPRQGRDARHTSRRLNAPACPNFLPLSIGAVDPINDDVHMRLRLLHAWMSRGLDSGSLRTNSEWRRIWMVEVPQLALQHENVLYALLALSATQLRGKTPEDQRLAVVGMEYWNKALVEQQHTISRIPSASIEASTFSALLISINAFAMLRDRSIEPYAAPVEWLLVSRGAWTICPFQDDIQQNSPLRRVVDITACIWKTNSIHEGEIAQTYNSLLRYQTPLDNLSDLAVYRTTLAQLTTFRQAVLAQEPSYHHAKRICIFAQLLPPEFVTFLQERRPRALVILARFFALVAHTGALHFFGDHKSTIPQREVRAIVQAVPLDWQGLVVEALDEILAA